MKAIRLHVLLVLGPDSSAGLNRTGCSCPACWGQLRLNRASSAERWKNNQYKPVPVLLYDRLFAAIKMSNLFSFHGKTLSPLTDALFSNTCTHNRFREKQCVLFFLPFVAIWHSTIWDMTRYLVSLFIVSQTPRAIPWITSMQTVISP